MLSEKEFLKFIDSKTSSILEEAIERVTGSMPFSNSLQAKQSSKSSPTNVNVSSQPEEEMIEPSNISDKMLKSAAPLVQKANIEAEKQEDEYDIADIISATQDVTVPVKRSMSGTDKPEWDYDELFTLIEGSFDLKQPILVFGNPGVGKSSIIEDYAESVAAPQMGRIFKNWDRTTSQEKKDILDNPEKYFLLVKILPNKYTPEDILGVPKAFNQQDYLVTDKFMWIVALSRPGAAGILFLDELNTASARMLYGLYEIVLDRAAAGDKFAQDVAVMAAGNLANEFNTELSTLPDALVNRFTSGVLVADPDQWAVYAKKKEVLPVIIDFVLSDVKNFFYAPPASAEDPFVTPRSIIEFDRWYKYHIKKFKEKIKSGKEYDNKEFWKDVGNKGHGLLGGNWAYEFIKFAIDRSSFNMKNVIEQRAELQGKKSDYLNSLLGFVSNTLLSRAIKYDSKLKELKLEEICPMVERDPGLKEVLLGILLIADSLSTNAAYSLMRKIKFEIGETYYRLLLLFFKACDYEGKETLLPKLTQLFKDVKQGIKD